MAGRIRTIKPEVLDDERAANLSDAAWRLWVSSWVLADDYGNLRAHDKYLGGNVWQDTSRRVAAILGELQNAGLMAVYQHGGQRYAHVRGWDKHQRMDNAGKPHVPAPSDAASMQLQWVGDRFAEIRREFPKVAEVCRSTPTTDPDPDHRPGPPAPARVNAKRDPAASEATTGTTAPTPQAGGATPTSGSGATAAPPPKGWNAGAFEALWTDVFRKRPGHPHRLGEVAARIAEDAALLPRPMAPRDYAEALLRGVEAFNRKALAEGAQPCPPSVAGFAGWYEKIAAFVDDKRKATAPRPSPATAPLPTSAPSPVMAPPTADELAEMRQALEDARAELDPSAPPDPLVQRAKRPTAIGAIVDGIVSRGLA